MPKSRRECGSQIAGESHFAASRGEVGPSPPARSEPMGMRVIDSTPPARPSSICPAITAWELARAWPGAELVVVEDSGHTGSTAMEHALDAAADRLFTTISRQTPNR